MPARWLRLWFGFTEPVDRWTYFRHGLGLMLFKYGVDALLVWIGTGRFWDPVAYLTPLLTVRQRFFEGAPLWLPAALLAVALPFLWIGVSMSMRRAIDAGASPKLALLFFIPVVNLLLMLGLCLAPSRQHNVPIVVERIQRSKDRMRSAMLGVAASLGITLITVGIGVYLRRSYSAGLFLGVPFTIGYISSYIYNYHANRAPVESLAMAIASVMIAGGALVLFALEGAMCIAMAVPFAVVVAWPGAVLGRLIARRETFVPTSAGMVLLVPLVVSVEPRRSPPSHEVLTIVEIAAAPEVVWRHVVTFPDLPPPTEMLFRAGVAAPTRARIEGRGVGAIRYCDFTTGSFVEPITAWEENRLLAFDITAQAPPMKELSPYRNVNPPHLDGYFRATHGEFRLIPLPDGRTRLEGRTRYVVDMFPQPYWTLPARAIVTAIHARVLHHIQTLSEEAVH